MTMHWFECQNCEHEFQMSDESVGISQIGSPEQLADSISCPQCFGHDIEWIDEPSGWRETPTSEPARHISGVPDHAICWNCWMERGGDRSVTIYNAKDGNYVVAFDGEDYLMGVEEATQEQAERVAEKYREGEGWNDE